MQDLKVDNTHFIYDMGPTIFMEVYALYMTSQPRFMTSYTHKNNICSSTT